MPRAAYLPIQQKYGDERTPEFMKRANVSVPLCGFNEAFWVRISANVYNVPKDFEAVKQGVVRFVNEVLENE